MSANAPLALPQQGGRFSNPLLPELAGGAAIIAFIGLFAIWGFMAPVSGAAIAEGNLQVEAQRQSVQHPYGGVVSDLRVSEGQRVEKGETLMVLADADPRAKLDVLVAERDSLLAQQGRLNAERDGQDKPSFDALLTTRRNEPTVAEAVANEIAVMATRHHQYDTEGSILRAKVEQLQEQISGLNVQADGLQRQRELIEEEAAGARTLLEKGFTPKTRVLALERTEAQLDADRGAKLSDRGAAEQAINEAKLGIAKLDRDRIGEITDQLRKTQSQLSEISPKIDAAQDVMNRTRITAPVSGSIVGLTAFTKGGVIQPGAKVADVVADDQPLIVDARLPLMDISEIKDGAAADIRLTGVARNERPTLHGSVMTVSADKQTDERSGQGYYSVRTRINADDAKRSRVTLQAGMPAEVIVTTRPRTLVTYIFGPLMDELGGAFREK